MMAMLAAPMLGAVALGADASVWLLEQHRLQIAADAAAYAAALQLSNTAMQTGAPASYVTLATNEANAASGGGSLVGTMATPVVSVAADYSTVTVTLSSVASTYFVQMVNKAGVTLQADGNGRPDSRLTLRSGAQSHRGTRAERQRRRQRHRSRLRRLFRLDIQQFALAQHR